MSRVDFVVMGAAKSGTTALTDMLRASGGVFMPDRDELNFWAWDEYRPGRLRWGNAPEREWPVTSRSSYEALFDEQASETVCGECSVVYLESDFAIERLLAARPDVKLVCILREPVARALSGYAMAVRSGANRDAIETAFHTDRDRVRTGEYIRLLRPVLDLVDPAQLLLLKFDDLVKDPDSVRTELAQFLGLDVQRMGVLAHSNPGGLPDRQWLHRLTTHPAIVIPARRFRGSVAHRAVRRVRSNNLGAKPAISDRQRRALESHYRPQLLSLQEVTGFDVSDWIAGYNEADKP